MRLKFLGGALLLASGLVGCGEGVESDDPAGLAQQKSALAVCGDGVVEEAEQCDDGNLLPGDGCSPLCALSDPRLVITEMMTDPEPVRDGFGEWFELFNPTAFPIDLRGWRITDSKNRSHRIAASVVVAPGAYVTLGRYNNPGINGNLVFDYAYGNSVVLANQAASLTLREPAGSVIDVLNWDGGARWPNPAGRGRALQFGAEHDPGLINNNDGTKWCYAGTAIGNGMTGTPGAANTVCDAPICGDGATTGAEQCDDGNRVDGDGCDANCLLAPVFVITEVMTNPTDVTDANGEWFEVHNPTPFPANLRGWTIADDGADSHVIGSDVIVPAQGYVTLGRNANIATNGGVPVDYQYAGITLGNGADELILRNPAGVEIDRVAWDDGATWPDPANPGAALQLDANVDALRGDNNDGANWCLADQVILLTDRGTPGAANTPCAAPECGNGIVEFMEACDDGNLVDGDGCSAACQAEALIVITEIMSDPASVSDAAGEWFEVFNPTAAQVDMTGWTFSDLSGQSFTLVEPFLIPAGAYRVFGKSTNQSINGGIPVNYAFGARMSLANAPDAIIIRDAGGSEIDRVVWDSGAVWPNPRGNGRSAQLDANFNYFADDNNNGARWCRPSNVLPSGDVGTPGAPNRACPFCGDGTVDPGEACDDGNAIGGDGCEADCTLSPVCGDGNVDPGEACDDGNLIDGDGCQADCTLSPVCGNGVLEAGEACDDGNVVAGDGCSPACAFEPRVAIVEVMQDPNAVSDAAGEWFEIVNTSAGPISLTGWRFTDLANDNFTIVGDVTIAPGAYFVLGRNGNVATNGGITVNYVYGGAMSLANVADRIVILDAGGVEVDRVVWDNGAVWPNPQGRGRSMQFDGNLDPAADDNNVGANWCRPVSPIGSGDFGTPGAANDPCDAVGGDCGNGTIDAGETCDDGNVIAGDGCNGLCQIEDVCGDGVVVGAEECDDGNLVNNDGCDRLCTNEIFQQVAAEQTRTSAIAAGSSDYFFFTVDTDAFLLTETYGAAGGCPANTRFDLYTVADLQTPIASDDDGGVGVCSLLQLPLAPGDYALRVSSPTGAQIATYELDFTLVAATPSPGGQFAGRVAAGGSDLFGFANEAVGDVVIAIDDGAGACPAGVDSVVQVFQVLPNSRLLVGENDDGGLNPPCSELVLADLPVGNYYVFVGGKNGAALQPYVFNIGFGAAPVCGDGTQQVGEECDDGNLIDGDGCESDCTRSAICGDGFFDEGEECDDGNLADGDGCSAQCTLETDCGNGSVDGVEQCDDGNQVDGDGCSAICRVEPRIVITEVMTNPNAVDDLQGEWFEVYNPTPNTVDLLGWRFTDNAQDDFTVDISVIVPAGGYALLARLYDPASNGNLPTDFAYGLDMLLANQRNDRIIVINPQGVEIDRVEWINASWPNPATAGQSFQFNPALDPLVADNNVGTNWCRPTTQMGNGDFGTPRAANDPCP